MNCLIQARYSSKRLKGKVLKKIKNKEILSYVISSINKSKYIKNIIVLTSNKDYQIEKFCKKKKYYFFKGPLKNTFLRYKQFLIKNKNIKYFIRISADSPLIDYKILNKMILLSKKKKDFDLITNIFPRTFPKGQSIEILKSKTFLKIDDKKLNDKEKEHVTLYYYKNYKKFKILNFKNLTDMSRYNLSIDTFDDFKIIKKIIYKRKTSNMKELISLSKKYEKKNY